MFVWTQTKSGKVKTALFFPGVERQSDIFKCLGDLLITGYHNLTAWSADGNNWLFPSVIRGGTATNVGSTLSLWLKMFAPGSTNKAYQTSIIPTLPPDITAGSLRVGSANLMALYMPAELVANMTGHELTGQSALYEYLNVGVSQHVPGACALSGNQTPPWGQLGPAPVPPLLDALLDSGTLTAAECDLLADGLFNLTQGVCSPDLLSAKAATLTSPAQLEGSSRGLIRSLLATQFKWYSERQAAGEFLRGAAALRGVVQGLKKGGNAHELIIGWGAAINNKQTLDNAHMIGRSGELVSVQIVSAINAAAVVASSDIARLGALVATLGLAQAQQRTEILSLHGQLSSVSAVITAATKRLPRGSQSNVDSGSGGGGGGVGGGGGIDSLTSASSFSAASPIGLGSPRRRTSPPAASAGEMSTLAVSAVPEINAAAAGAGAGAGGGAWPISSLTVGSQLTESPAGMSLSAAWVRSRTNGKRSTVPAFPRQQDLFRFELAIKVMKHVATQEQLQLRMNASATEVAVLADGTLLQSLVIVRFRSLFLRSDMPVPKTLDKIPHIMTIGMVEERLKSLSDVCKHEIKEKQLTTVERAALLSQLASPAPPAAPPASGPGSAKRRRGGEETGADVNEEVAGVSTSPTVAEEIPPSAAAGAATAAPTTTSMWGFFA